MCFASAQHKKHTTLNQCVILKQKMYYILQTHNRKEEKKNMVMQHSHGPDLNMR